MIRFLLAYLAVFCCGISRRAVAVDFEKEIAPIIAKRCLECHNARDAMGGLNLTRRETAFKGGDSGPAIVPNKIDQSHLIERVTAGEMPPKKRGQSQRLPAAELASLKSWIASGAGWPKNRTLNIYEKTSDVRAGLDWWSLQPVKRPQPPVVAGVLHPIDRFILSRLRKAGLEPAPLADRRTLIRRATFDLTGLPPSPEETKAFLEDKSPGAYEELIDRLLKSQHYGERWARHWLDVVRFAETNGYERDKIKPNIWKYRDWVIQAFNTDMPYSRFVIDQLAGDEVTYRSEQSVVATGMLRGGTWNDEPNDAADYLYERLEDMIHTTTSAFVGLTVKCARCHDHKFDPIRQTDYYRTASFFWPGYIGQANLGGPSSAQLGFDVFGWTDKSSNASPIRLLIKGERTRPGPVVEPGFLSAIKALDKPLALPPAGSKTTHRRLQFAKWIANRNNPLTARVFVNRLWLHHFGYGLVRTPNNFGFKSDPPTHPGLLNWLAAEFMDGGWKIKRIHKMIMMSRVYRQSSTHPKQADYAEKDFTNRLWWRSNRRRLDAESLRDAMLTTSGQLNRKMGGPSFYPRMSSEALEGLSRKSSAWQQSSARERARRSVYMMTKRSRLLPLMTTFDFVETTLPCAKRDVTTVAPQALALLNNHFVHGQSRAFAQRLRKEFPGNPQRQIARAWQLALGRSPTSDEVEAALIHLTRQQKRFQENSKRRTATAATRVTMPDPSKLVLWLRADKGIETDDNGAIRFWRDQAAPTNGQHRHHASQAVASARPQWIANAIGKHPAIRFNGKNQFLQVTGQILWSQKFTVMAVVTDKSGQTSPREILSNWHRRGRSVTSVFLGTSASRTVRFTDSFGSAGQVVERHKPFILTGVSGSQAATYQNAALLRKSKPLSTRDLAAPYVIGTQGNYGKEWWQGEIAEILVYDRALTDSELQQAWGYLSGRYQIRQAIPVDTPRQLALGSLCHVLLNTNEFIYID